MVERYELKYDVISTCEKVCQKFSATADEVTFVL